MCSLKTENAVIMLFSGIAGFFETVIVVTIPAIRNNALFFELSLVVISVTVGASSVRQRGC